MERADRLAACKLPIQPAGLLQGALAVDADKGIDPRLPCLGPGESLVRTSSTAETFRLRMSRAIAWSSSSRTSLVINRPERLHDTKGRGLVVEGERAGLVTKESARLPQLRRKLLGALAVDAVILQRGHPKQVLDIL